jgi:hypothetical protein
MLTSYVFWAHDVLVGSGLVDRLLAGDTSLCATVGILVGGTIGWNRLKQQRND